MTSLVWTGLGLTLLAGMASGNCMLPMKFARRWQWENLWLVFTLVSLVAVPWCLALLLVNQLWSVYCTAGMAALTLPLLFGFGWGIAQILFGLSIARLGLALGYAVIIGLGSLGGTLVPLMFHHRSVIFSAKGALIFAGLVAMIAGIAISACAGSLREKDHNKARGGSYAAALILAVVCGLLAPMINYAFAFGQPVADRAIALGSTPVNAAYAVWPVALAGGLLPNLFYSFYLLGKNGTWGRFRETPLRDGSLALAMGLLWMGSIAIYGVASVYLGALGTSVGWGMFQIFMIITANSGGLLAGEWREAPRAARVQLYSGLGMLIVATLLLSAANR
ncbi:MAG: L-rhamnose/proton symporter RhaT [Terracidiphilus sp.]|nr:L-rhamnose/proton symporter RhaT [Terracidiphilus sp.]